MKFEIAGAVMTAIDNGMNPETGGAFERRTCRKVQRQLFLGRHILWKWQARSVARCGTACSFLLVLSIVGDSSSRSRASQLRTNNDETALLSDHMETAGAKTHRRRRYRNAIRPWLQLGSYHHFPLSGPTTIARPARRLHSVLSMMATPLINVSARSADRLDPRLCRLDPPVLSALTKSQLLSALSNQQSGHGDSQDP